MEFVTCPLESNFYITPTNLYSDVIIRDALAYKEEDIINNGLLVNNSRNAHGHLFIVITEDKNTCGLETSVRIISTWLS